MSSSVSPIVANLYMEGVESTALGSFKWTAPVLGYRYAADTWVAIKTQEVEASTKQIHSSGLKQMFTREDSRILDCVVGLEAHTHTDQYLLWLPPPCETQRWGDKEPTTPGRKYFL